MPFEKYIVPGKLSDPIHTAQKQLYTPSVYVISHSNTNFKTLHTYLKLLCINSVYVSQTAFQLLRKCINLNQLTQQYSLSEIESSSV